MFEGGQMSKEYEELRENIANKICEDIKSTAYHTADEILSIIADKCWFKVSTPADFTALITGHLPLSHTNFREISDAYYNAGYRPVKEIKKDG
jgi:hypothetical protein